MKKAECERNEIVGHLIAGLKRRRAEAGLSQNRTAARAGIDQSMVGRLEKRERIPTIDTLLRFSDAVGADFPELVREAVALVRPGKDAVRAIASGEWRPALAGNGARGRGHDAGAPLRNREPVRMADIAAHLGVSRLTVSAVLNNRHGSVRISEETAAKVRAAAAQLGYVRNHLAIATKTGRSFSVGVIVSRFASEWVARVLSGFIGVAKQRGYLVNIEDVSGSVAEQAALTRFMEQRVGGIFCCNLNPDGNFPELLAETSQRYGCPVVSTISHPRLSGERVDSDDEAGGTMAAQHLWELGHRRIASVGLTLNRRRSEAFANALTGLGGTVPPEWLLTRAKEDAETETTLLALLTGTLTKPRRGSPAKTNRPTAVFCASDELASFVMRAARRCGLLVPRDLSVVGFADERVAHLLDPRLTTIAQPFEDMGQRGAELLFQQMDGRVTESVAGNGAGSGAEAKCEMLPVRLVVRESTAKV
ncbi:helix-turn-helix domain-containing protein [Opitutaceae bacterium TAV4]|nr:helix-turn-helix domain-containing protein [Opitutaceae bacterium TAV4]RRK00067.1 helix-turn-helix domain-containing protein [Opitutaceae bacterium TAV3]